MFIPEGFANVIYLFSRTGDAELMQVALGIDWSTAIGADTADDLADAWRAEDAMQDITTTSTFLQRVELQVGLAGGEYQVFESTNGPFQGAAAEEPLPQNCALLVKKLTADPGRKGRGRMFYPDVQVSATNPLGFLDAASLLSYQSRIEVWIDAVANVENVGQPFLLHTLEADAPSALTQMVVQPQIATQRRRLRP